MIAMIGIEELRESYGEVFAVDGITLTARARILGLPVPRRTAASSFLEPPKVADRSGRFPPHPFPGRGGRV